VQVRVDVAPKAARVLGLGDVPLRVLGDLVEVQPPQRARDQERDRERDDDLR
jgi:hypothetical protein